MIHLIDSDLTIDHLDDIQAASSLLDALAGDGIAISIITYMEVLEGRLRATDPVVAHAKFDAFLENVPIVPFSLDAARRCALIREDLRRRSRRVRPRALDLITAAIALEHDLTLVTRNSADYDDIPGLKLYAW